MAETFDLTGMKFLIVDDSEDNLDLLEMFLTKYGAEVITAVDGEIAIAKAFQNKFDAILMDVQMPVMDGYEATRVLRAKGFKGPVYAVTGHLTQEHLDEAAAAGCTTHIAKPIKLKEMLVTLAGLRKSEK